MKSVVVFYSRTGNSAKVAKALAGSLGADLSEITAPGYERGLLGYMRAGRDSIRDHMPKIEFPHEVTGADLLVIVGPVWASRPATPLRAYLKQVRDMPFHVAAILTHGGSSPDEAFEEIESLAGQTLDGRLAISDADVKHDRFHERLAEFALQERAYSEPLGLGIQPAAATRYQQAYPTVNQFSVDSFRWGIGRNTLGL